MFVTSVRMDLDTIERQRQEIVTRSGPWTAHNFLLAPGLYTMGSEEPQPVPGYPIGGAPDELKLRRIIQIVSDLSREPIERLRVLTWGASRASIASSSRVEERRSSGWRDATRTSRRPASPSMR